MQSSSVIPSRPITSHVRPRYSNTNAPVTLSDLSELREDMIHHIYALEILLTLVLFNMVLFGAYLSWRYLRPTRRHRHVLLPSASSSTISLNKTFRGEPERAASRSSNPTTMAVPATLEGPHDQPAALLRIPYSRMRLPEVDPFKATPARPTPANVVDMLEPELKSNSRPTVSGRRRLSFPRSVFGASTEAQSAVGPSSTFPRLSNFLNRLQHTYPQQALGICKASFTAEELRQPLDELRGTTAASLCAKGMLSAQADFLARAIEQELEWIQSDREGGGNGFRMVLNA